MQVECASQGLKAEHVVFEHENIQWYEPDITIRGDVDEQVSCPTIPSLVYPVEV